MKIVDDHAWQWMWATYKHEHRIVGVPMYHEAGVPTEEYVVFQAIQRIKGVIRR